MAKSDDRKGPSPHRKRVRSTTVTATVCDLVELDVSIYGPTVLVVHDKHGRELYRMDLAAGAWVTALDATVRK